MRIIFAAMVASLVVVCALFFLVSEDPWEKSGSLTLHTERVSDLEDGLLKTLLVQMVQRKRESGRSGNPVMIAKAQRRLKEAGFYSGRLDGVMNHGTHDALRSLQQSKQLRMTGEIDGDTARELGLQD